MTNAKNVLTVAALSLAGLLVIALILVLARDTPLGMLPAAGILWAVLAPIPAFVANRNGRSFIGYLALSLVLSPPVGLVVVLFLGKARYLRERHRYRAHEIVIPL